MNLTPTTDWILIIEAHEDLWAVLQGHLRQLLPRMQRVQVINVITNLSHLQTRLIEQQPLPRLVFSNLYLPHRADGLHLLTAFKSSSSGFSHLPLVMMSSSTDPDDERAVLEASTYFLGKPAVFTQWPV